ncbi:cell division protein ZapA [Sinomicrobium soli]|uniref:cell division protein ZapA n=1 Tax=Sinomicrobium sp. N-1-3-6 TaxID=2219864 RepID=UPI000DCF0D24|nr:cell division protein ZapA [Sinomicrobium sp. N-1-3-6]RAV30004.1 cell division protein ZapA [Sinomicrobium sp. N-1-3-6]
MDDKLRIKISIADRVYPLTIDPSQEEGLRKAAKSIEGLVKQFEQNYAVRDKQDVLAMCALQFASQLEQKSIDKERGDDEVVKRLEALNELLHSQLSS